MEAMAKKQNQFDIVGFGGGASIEEGLEFVDDHELSFKNFYDESRSAWQAFAVNKQPAWVLYGADGTELTRGAGGVNEADILAAL